MQVGQRLDQFVVERLLGRGGMGEVWLARDSELGRPVALKVLSERATDPSGIDRLRLEARAASTLSHPNVCTVYALGSTGDGRRYIAMEYVGGETLRLRLQRGPLDVVAALDVAIAVASALTAAHAAGIVHRDLKPENVILTPDGVAKVLDFGLAKVLPLASDPGADTMLLQTTPGTIVGTVAYMSPEQARGRVVDARTDIWSLGVVVYEMVSGTHPFAAESHSDVLAAILDREPAPLPSSRPGFPPELLRIIGKMLRKDREQRYQVVKDVLLDLQAVRADLLALPDTGHAVAADLVAPAAARRKGSHGPGAASGSSGDGVVDRGHRLPWTVIAALGAAAIVGSASGAWYLWPRLKPISPGTTVVVARPFTRVTLEEGFQGEASWSPDGRSIAYASDRAGNLDIWTQRLDGSDQVQLTKSSAGDWEPAWSPDGATITFRSERDGGGLFAIPAGGGLERRLTTFGARPRWSPDGSRILFGSSDVTESANPALYTVGLDGAAPRRFVTDGTMRLSGYNPWDWHPDGRHVSVLATTTQGDSGLFLVPLTAGASAPGKVLPMERSGAWDVIIDYRWSPDGRRVYLTTNLKAVSELWRVDLPARAGEAPRAERLMTGGGGGEQTDPATSPDGRRLLFGQEDRKVRVWSLGLDPSGRRLTGQEQPLTRIGMSVANPDMTPDGRLLVYERWREGANHTELVVVDMESGREQVSVHRDQHRWGARWAADGSRVAYCWSRVNEQTRTAIETAVVVRESARGDERPLARFGSSEYQFVPSGWSPDGRSLLVSSNRWSAPEFAIHLLRLADAPAAEERAVRVTGAPRLDLWQATFSPNGRWIAFLAQHLDQPGVSTVHVIPASGGDASRWRRVTDSSGWADKPRWSPDGRTLYYLLRESAMFNVWGVGFDPDRGRAVGSPFPVTHFQGGPARMIYPSTGLTDLAVVRGRLILPIMDVRASIWMLERVDR